ncbi:MAG: acyltransferase [Acidimicrobiales bacterium]
MTRIDPTAVVEQDVRLGEDVVVWHFARVRAGAQLGAQSRLGAGAYVGAGVHVGDRCKIENGGQVFEGAWLGDGVFVGPGAILANDLRPRAVTPDGLLKEAADWECSGVTVEDGASIGAGAVVLPGVRVGSWSLIAAGAVVVRSPAPYELVAGVPARHAGWVCRCATRIEPPGCCASCGLSYRWEGGFVVETPA